MINLLRQDQIIIPEITVIERICAEAITRGNQAFYQELIHGLSNNNLQDMDQLLKIRGTSKISNLAWLQQAANIPKPKYILAHIARLQSIKDLNLHQSLGKNVHHNRLIKLAKEGRNMFARDIQELDKIRKYATITAIILETRASIIDEIVDLNDKILGNIFNRAKNSHNNEFQSQSKSINEKLNLYLKVGQALIAAKQNNENPFSEIESIISWDEFTQSVNDTQQLAKPNNFDSLYRVTGYYSWIKRYTLPFLEILDFKCSSNASDLLNALSILKDINKNKLRKVPDNAPTSFIRKQWQMLVFKADEQLDKQFYEFAVLSELKNALRSGDIWVVGSRKYKDFEEYLLDPSALKRTMETTPLPTVGQSSFQEFIQSRIKLLTDNLMEVNALAIDNMLQDASINKDGLKITPLANSVPDEVSSFSQKIYVLLPKIKITNLLQEVDGWVNYSQRFTHLKNDKPAGNKPLLLTVVLSDAINLGLTKMAEACPGTTYTKLASMQAWHIRESTYKHTTAAIVNAQHQQSITQYWGDGSSSSSNGQRFRAGGRNTKASSVIPKYGNESGITYYSHTSDAYAPFYIDVIANVRDSTYVLDGLLYHEADIDIYEHYTDTAGFTDHVFALMHQLCCQVLFRVMDFKDLTFFLKY